MRLPPAEDFTTIGYQRLFTYLDIILIEVILIPWWRRRDSNSQQSACKAGALPVVLHPQIYGAQDGIRTHTVRLLKPLSPTNCTTWAYSHIVVTSVYYHAR